MSKILIYGVVILVVVLIIVITIKKKNKEGYSEVLIHPSYTNDEFVTRPSFKAELAPRFDPYRMSGGMIKSSYGPMDQQGAGITPLVDSENIVSATGSAIPNSEVDYASVISERENINDFDKSCTAIGNDVISDFKKQQGYIDAKEMLPVPDIRSCLKDPSDPDNYMYDRTLFAPLKRRNANIDVDWIRGDLYIEPIRTGWFDTPSIPGVDLVKGAIPIITDPVLDLEDTIYSRSKPLESLTYEEKMAQDEATLPWGDIKYHMPQ